MSGPTLPPPPPVPTPPQPDPPPALQLAPQPVPQGAAATAPIAADAAALSPAMPSRAAAAAQAAGVRSGVSVLFNRRHRAHWWRRAALASCLAWAVCLWVSASSCLSFGGAPSGACTPLVDNGVVIVVTLIGSATLGVVTAVLCLVALLVTVAGWRHRQ